MLSEKQIKEIREHLDRAQNPIFFFDNDVDGLCSFLLLRRFIDRGYGVAIKSYPELDVNYARKIDELNADYVFVLDKPVVSDGFKEAVKEKGIPFVWIDHHNIDPGNLNGIEYYNPSKVSDNSEPVTYLCWKVISKNDDLWIALCGCIADAYLPDFSGEVKKQFPDLWRDVGTAFEGVYETEMGKITQIMSFGLKDRTTNVISMMKFLGKASPHDVLEESSRNTALRRFNQINEKYQGLLKKAKNLVGESRLIYFQYGGDLSLSGDIANELIYRYPDKIVVVVYLKGNQANLSLRGKGVRKITLKALKGIEGATGEGHEEATGAKMSVEDLPLFKSYVEELLSHKNLKL